MLIVSFVKLAVLTFFSFVMFETMQMLMDGGTLQVPNFSAIIESPVATAGILYTGLITTALALRIESVAFSKVPATDASLILTTEPLFAAGFGAVALRESFGTSDYIGAAFILRACVLSIFIDNSVSEESEPAIEVPSDFQAYNSIYYLYQEEKDYTSYAS